MPTLDWIGKKAVVNHHKEVPFHLLKCDPDLSVGDPESGNLLVQGDNLLALKSLLPYYAGQVKCIYIDPPYNTGNEKWVYNDNVNSPEIKEWLGNVVGKEAEDLSRHDKWLCMMYPRLRLLGKFLREDGILFVSIDDTELADIKLLINEIFGELNVLATIVWEKGKKGDSKFFSVTHEYIVAVAKSKSHLVAKNTKWRKRKEGIDEVFSYYNQLRKKYASDHEEIRKEIMKWYRSLPKENPAKKHKHYNWSDDRGLYFPDNFHGPDDGRKNRPRYDISHPITGKPCAKPSTGWRWEEDRTLKALADNPPRIHFGADETTIPCRKSYLEDVNDEPFQSVFYKDGRAATLEVEQIIGPGKFSFPKDSDTLSELIGIVSGDGDLILDSFAGSGSTGHAVLKLNNQFKEERKFILVEMEADICSTITRERLKRAVEGYTQQKRKGKKGNSVEGLGSGFNYCRLDETLFDSTGQIAKTVSFIDLARFVFFKETGLPLPDEVSGKSPLIGTHNGTGVYLLYNGILGDKTPQGGNALTRTVLAGLPPHDGPKVVFGTSCRVGLARLKQENVIFRQIPYELKVD